MARKLKPKRPPWKTDPHWGTKHARWKRFADKKRARVARHYQREALKPVVSRFTAPAVGLARFGRRLLATARVLWRQLWR